MTKYGVYIIESLRKGDYFDGEKLSKILELSKIRNNPNAKIFLDKSIFENVRQIWINDKGEFDGIMIKTFVFHSLTITSEIT